MSTVRQSAVLAAAISAVFSVVIAVSAMVTCSQAYGASGHDFEVANQAGASKLLTADSFDMSRAQVSPIPPQVLGEDEIFSDACYPSFTVTLDGRTLHGAWNFEDEDGGLDYDYWYDYDDETGIERLVDEEGVPIDYFYDYENNDRVGTARITITGADPYHGSTTASFVIQGRISSSTTVCFDNRSSFDPEDSASEYRIGTKYLGTPEYEYGEYDEAIEPTPKVMFLTHELDEYDDEQVVATRLKKGRDYTLTYKNNEDIGKGTVIVTGIGNYVGSMSKTFRIKGDIEFADAFMSKTEYQYTGSKICPKPRLSFRGKKLALGTDYILSYRNNKNEGTAQVIAKGKGDFAFEKEIDFTIVARPLSKAKISKIKTQYFKGSPVKVNPVVRYNGERLEEDFDYRLTYKNNAKAGKATVRITGIGRYKGTVTRTFRIVGDLSAAKVASVRFKISNGRAIEPAPKVTLGKRTLKRNRDYTLSYANNVGAGRAAIIVKAKGKNYKGTTTRNFTIIQGGYGRDITRSEFNRIRDDMTYSEVKAVIGGGGTLIASYRENYTTSKTYEWKSASGWGGALVSFRAGKVSIKSQHGL